MYMDSDGKTQKKEKDFNSLNSVTDDSCAYWQRLSESTSPFRYHTDPTQFESCRKCHQVESGFIGNLGGRGPSVGPRRVDMESDLKGQTRLLTRCPERKYNPFTYDTCKKCQNCNTGLPCGCQHCRTRDIDALADCRPGIVPVDSLDTRAFNACNPLNGLFINRFEHVCENPQDPGRWEFYKSNRRLGEETRLDNRDNYPVAVDGQFMDCNNASLDNMRPCRKRSGTGCRHMGDFAKNIII